MLHHQQQQLLNNRESNFVSPAILQQLQAATVIVDTSLSRTVYCHTTYTNTSDHFTSFTYMGERPRDFLWLRWQTTGSIIPTPKKENLKPEEKTEGLP